MVRKILTGENSSIQPILSLSLFAVCIAASIAIVSFLCGGFSRKKSHSRENLQNEARENSDVVISTLTGEAAAATTISSRETPNTKRIALENTRDGSHRQDETLAPPLVQGGSASNHVRSKSEVPQQQEPQKHGKLLSSLSMGKKESKMGSRQQSQNGKKKEKKLKHEDSIWRKTIILGEKCRVPEEDDDAIIYDEKGNRISTYHRKTASLLPVSRQSSYIDQNAIS